MTRFEFHPVVARWFEQTFGTPTAPQERGWPAIQSHAHTLISAPTGAGKTLAAFLASLDSLFRLGLEQKLKDQTYVLYVSPLKALSNDIHKNLDQPLAGIRQMLLGEQHSDIEVRAAVRTGDTPPAQRAAMLKKPPHILVTTPESFYLLLTSQSGRRMLSTVQTLIVDEIHALVADRRGSHLALSMERLAALTNGPLQRIGLSATQRPIEEVARFLVGNGVASAGGNNPPPRCAIVDSGHLREMDLAIELPGSPLEAVMSNEVWTEVYSRLAELIQSHRTTLIFVNTRRLAERVTRNLCALLGEDKVTSHHGSLSARLRLDAENRLKRGELKALAATSSLELGIDIGAVDLVCQLGSTRSIAACLQRVGRAGHSRGGLPKGRLFPLTRDELIECVATMRCVRQGQLDLLRIPQKPLDVLAQQIVATVAAEDWQEDKLLAMVRAAYPYRDLTDAEFAQVVRMLAEGFSTKRGRRAALIHYDAVNGRLRERRGARLIALTSGGAIPDSGDYRVVLQPEETFIGTVNEDFAIESLAGDVFQLGNASWRIVQVVAGVVRVEDAHGQPPGIPFWLGEAPARTAELSRAVSQFRQEAETKIQEGIAAGKTPDALQNDIAQWIGSLDGLPSSGAKQLADYLIATFHALGALPSQNKLIIERFFDESGGMQLVIHSPFGARLNRAWGLALRKRFCRSFNFELQSAASDDAILLSLGTQHSFALDEVFRYLNSKSAREVLVQALLDAPMFTIRWRWNAARSLALPRFRNGRKTPAALQRMEAENLLAAVFPDQLACLENIPGDREVPDHPLVRQTVEDCLIEAMDVCALESLLRRMESGQIECLARDLPEPSPLAHEIINSRVYTFLDDAPLEERRARAVHLRRTAGSSAQDGAGILDAAAIERVCQEAWPRAAGPDELHEALLLLGVMTDAEAKRCSDEAATHLALLAAEKRAGRMTNAPGFWVPAERLGMARAVYPAMETVPPISPPPRELVQDWWPADAIRELLRGRMEVSGPVTASALAGALTLPLPQINRALLALEGEGFILRGKFRPDARDTEWCDRRLLARIHRLTVNRLRAEIQPVSIADFQRFLMVWQRAATEHRAEGPGGAAAVIEMLDGYELPAAAWEPDVLAARVKHYSPEWTDRLCLTGRVGWGRLSPPQAAAPFPSLRSSPMNLFLRENLRHWTELSPPSRAGELTCEQEAILDTLRRRGALFFDEIAAHTRVLRTRLEDALAQLAAQGWVTSDSFEGLRVLLLPSEKRAPVGDAERPRRHAVVSGVESAGRWWLLRAPQSNADPSLEKTPQLESQPREEAIAAFARILLRRYGIVFRRLLDRETLKASWFELGRFYRRLEARGEIRGGYFISGVSGEQFALPQAVDLLRSVRKAQPSGELIALSAADPLNLVGILTPGARVASIRASRILFRDGLPIAALHGGQILNLANDAQPPAHEVERALTVGSLPPSLRPYYG